MSIFEQFSSISSSELDSTILITELSLLVEENSSSNSMDPLFWLAESSKQLAEVSLESLSDKGLVWPFNFDPVM